MAADEALRIEEKSGCAFGPTAEVTRSKQIAMAPGDKAYLRKAIFRHQSVNSLGNLLVFYHNHLIRSA